MSSKLRVIILLAISHGISHKFTPQTSLGPLNGVPTTVSVSSRVQPRDSTTPTPDPCVSEWISYWQKIMRDKVKSQVESQYDSTRDKKQWNNWTNSERPKSKYNKTTFAITTVSTLTTPLSSLCDGFARAQSVAETTLSYIETVTDEFMLDRIYNEKQRLRQNAPCCQVPQADCTQSWARFVGVFRSDNLEMAKYLGAPSCDDAPVNGTCVSDEIVRAQPFDISAWKNHLFENCTDVLPRLRAWSLATLLTSPHAPNRNDLPFSELVGLPGQELSRKLDGYFSCEVFVDAFVLFHFPLAIPTTRDICTNSGYGDFFSYLPLSASTNPAMSAVVTAASFGMHDLRKGEASIALAPPSLSSFTGHWNFYPSNVYLAMNTITVSRLGGAPKIYSNYILTLDPSVLSSQVYRCEADHCISLKRPFNYADLQPTLPASAYFADDQKFPTEGKMDKAWALFNGRMHDTIVHGNYWPTIALPEAITSIDPELFRTCSLSNTWSGPSGSVWINPGIFDPPVVLSPLATMAVPTLVAPQLGGIVQQIQEGKGPTLNTPSATATIPPQPDRTDVLNVMDAHSNPATTIASIATTTALRELLLSQLSLQALKVGTPPLQVGDIIISRAPDGGFVVELPRGREMEPADHPDPTAESKSTVAHLPESLIDRFASEALQPGGLKIGDAVISRAADGNYVVKSSKAYMVATTTAEPDLCTTKLASKTTVTGLPEDQDGTFDIQSSKDSMSATKTATKKSGVKITTRLLHNFLPSLLVVLLVI